MIDSIELITSNLYLTAFIVYIYSAFLISFCNVVIYRLPIMLNFEYAQIIKPYLREADKEVDEAYEEGLNLGLSKPNSRCNNCLSPIKIYNNIPIVSYIVNSGKCVNCKFKYPSHHFFTELIAPVFAVLLYLVFGLTIDFAFALVIFFTAYVIIGIDFKHKIIPDQLVILLGFIILLINTTSTGLISVQESLINVAITFVLLNIFYKVINIKYSFGYGDVKLLIVISALFSLNTFVYMLLIASIIGIIEILIVKKLFYNDSEPELAFGPSIMISTMLFFVIQNTQYSHFITL